jgi:hypothetical protein
MKGWVLRADVEPRIQGVRCLREIVPNSFLRGHDKRTHTCLGGVVMRILKVSLLLCLIQMGAASAGALTMDWVTVGGPGNVADPSTGIGSVATTYRISKYEVTNAQYTEFLNSVAASDPNQLFDPSLGTNLRGITRSGTSGSYVYSATPGTKNMPVNYVYFESTLRFANWLQNGQPAGAQDTGTTEDGAYTFTAPFPGSPRSPETPAPACFFRAKTSGTRRPTTMQSVPRIPSTQWAEALSRARLRQLHQTRRIVIWPLED